MASIIWDMKNNTEIECFDHGLDSGVFWGSLGEPYVIFGDRIYMAEMGLCLKQFRVSYSQNKEMKQTQGESKYAKMKKARKTFGLQFGHCFDSETHS